MVARFDKKIAAYGKKRTYDSREESIAEYPEEEPITEDLKRTLSRTLSQRNLKKTLSILKRNPSLRTLQKTLSLRTLRNFKTLDYFCVPKNFFVFLVMVYYRVGDEDKFLYENFGLGMPRFYATVT